MNYEKLALDYHEKSPKGKIAIHCTKPLDSQEDLSLAYSPGVAGPCREIQKNHDDSFRYTGRGNLVGVISNGSAVLGLGNIGPYASKPVMEGKAMLFKKFADIDVFDIEVNASDPDEFIRCVKALEPTFGGINLEDIKAPDCFYIEEKLREMMSIPVFHDDQHGTAIIASAAFLNALELTNRDIQKVRVVFCGAGAAAIACANLLVTLGVKKENLIMCDSKGVIHTSRVDLDPYKSRFAQDTDLKTLEDACRDADAFIGVSSQDLLKPEMLSSMRPHPIVFALANPNPEIRPELAHRVRDDVIIATGRSDYLNQVNNVLGFPYIFRGALDVGATTINEEMKLAAVKAIASLAKESVPEDVLSLYKRPAGYVFGKDYLIPKPVDQRVLLKVAPAVAKAAMSSKVARKEIDIEEYEHSIERILGPTRRIIRNLRKNIMAQSQKKNQSKPRILVTYGEEERTIKAVKQVDDDGEIQLVLLGSKERILKKAESIGIKSWSHVEIIDPLYCKENDQYAQTLYEIRKRRGVSRTMADHIITDHNYFGATLLYRKEIDGMITGLTAPYRNSMIPLLEINATQTQQTLAGVYMMVRDEQLYFFSDCTMNIDPTASELAEITLNTVEVAKSYTSDPISVAMLGFTNFSSSKNEIASKVAQAVHLVKEKSPHLEIDGEMQVDIALQSELRNREFPFCNLKNNPNVLIFPSLAAANIGYKLLTNFTHGTPIGPILAGTNFPAHVMQRTAKVNEIVNMIYIAAHQGIPKKEQTSLSKFTTKLFHS